MKYYSIISFLLILSHCVYGQYSPNSSNSKEVKNFHQTTTLVVLQNHTEFDSAFVKAIKEQWTTTPYKFISKNEIQQYISNDSFSFLLAHNFEFTRNNDISVNIETRNYLCLINGGRNKLSRYQFSDLVAFSPFDFYGLEQDRMQAAYRLKLMVSSIQKSLHALRINGIRGNELSINQHLSEYYNRKVNIIKTKTLLIDPDMLSPKLSEEKIKGVYPFPFIISNKNWIKTAISSNESDYCYLVNTNSYDKSIQIIDLQHTRLCYSYYALSGMGKLTKRDFKRITKTYIKATK